MTPKNDEFNEEEKNRSKIHAIVTELLNGPLNQEELQKLLKIGSSKFHRIIREMEKKDMIE